MKQKGFLKGEIIVLILIVAVIVIFALYYVNQKNTTALPGVQNEKDNISIPAKEDRLIDHEFDEGVALMPQGFPVEDGAENTSSYRFVPAGTTDVQTTLVYMSKRAFTENVEIFRNYLSQTGFEMINEESEDKFYSFYGTNQTTKSEMSVVISAQNEIVDISVTYLQRAQ